MLRSFRPPEIPLADVTMAVVLSTSGYGPRHLTAEEDRTQVIVRSARPGPPPHSRSAD